MAFFSWSRWLRSLLRPQTKPLHKRNSRLHVERLEDRLAPATFQWTGTAGDGKWGTGGNWSGGMAPSASSSVPCDLVFPSISGTLALTNNIGTGTTPLKVNSISFSGSGYTLEGNSILLGGTSGAINISPGLKDTIAMGMTLGGSGTSQQVFTIGANATLTLDGALAGTAGAGWTQTGSGTMILDADNSGFTGAFTVAGGVTQIQTATALGTSVSASNVTTVQAGANCNSAASTASTFPST